ncbi:MAG TPA: hypothetical protein VFR67_20390 [Pilimelia sp.]|nr:hypothetical protein [Pilimelia sp.]
MPKQRRRGTAPRRAKGAPAGRDRERGGRWPGWLVRVLRRPGHRLAAVLGTVLVAALTAVFVTLGQNAGSRIAEQIGLDPAPSAPPGATPSETEQAEAFSAAVSVDIGDMQEFALPRALTGGTELDQLISGAADRDLGGFIDRHSGGPVGRLDVGVTLTGHRAPAVLVTDIGIRMMAKAAPLAGTRIVTPLEGEVRAIVLRMNLDEPRPALRDKHGPYFAAKSISLNNGEQQPLRITFTAAAAAYEFVLAVGFVDARGEQHTVYVDRRGHQFASADTSPAADRFRLTGPARRYGVSYRHNADRPGFSVEPAPTP